MGNAVADSSSDANADKRFRLLQDEEAAAPSPVPLTQGVGKPPEKPPAAPPLAAAAAQPDPKKGSALEIQNKELKAENEQLLSAVYYLQQELKQLRRSK